MSDDPGLYLYQGLNLTVHVTDKGILLETQDGLFIPPHHWAKIQEGVARGLEHLLDIIEDRNQFVGLCKYEPEDRAGYVYIVKAASGEYKIGHSNNLPRWLSQFGLQLPFPVELVLAIPANDRIGLERHLHERFADLRMHGEWFKLADADIASLLAMCEAAEIVPIKTMASQTLPGHAPFPTSVPD